MYFSKINNRTFEQVKHWISEIEQKKLSKEKTLVALGCIKGGIELQHQLLVDCCQTQKGKENAQKITDKYRNDYELFYQKTMDKFDKKE